MTKDHYHIGRYSSSFNRRREPTYLMLLNSVKSFNIWEPFTNSFFFTSCKEMSSIFFSARGTTSKVQLRSILTNFSYIKGNYQELQKISKLPKLPEIQKITGNYCKLPEIPLIYRNLQENYRFLPKIIGCAFNCP